MAPWQAENSALRVQWLGLSALTAGPGSTPGLRTKIRQAAGLGEKKKKRMNDLVDVLTGDFSSMVVKWSRTLWSFPAMSSACLLSVEKL